MSLSTEHPARVRRGLAALLGLILAAPLVPAAGIAHQASDQPAGPAMLHRGEHAGIGPYLVDQAGMSLYLFEADTQAEEGGAEAASACEDDCVLAWPPLITDGEPEAHDELDPALLGTLTRHDGETQVTYGGWPLYYHAADRSPGHARGQDIESHGGEWYLVTPGGEPAEEH